MEQHELFTNLPRATEPGREVAEFRVGEKIIAVPLSFWKDGRAARLIVFESLVSYLHRRFKEAA